MFEERQNTTSSPMDKESAANLDELKQSVDIWDAEEHTMSEEDKHESSTGGLTQQKVQQHLKHLSTMRRVFAEHRGDVLEDEEFNCPNISPTQSEESICTYSSWCSNPDSDISEIIAFDVQDVDEEIKKVCQRFLDPENLEEEHFSDRGDVWTSETGSVSSLSIRSEEFQIPASAASSPSATTPITEAAKMLVSQVIEEAVRTMQTIEAVRKIHTNDSNRKAEKPASKSFFKKLRSVWKSRFGRKQSKRVKKVSEQDVDKVIEERGASFKFDLSSTPLELIEEEEDTTENENFVPSPASTSSFSPEGQPQAQTATDFQEDLKSWKSRDNSCDEALMASSDTDEEMMDKLAIEGQEEYENIEFGGQTDRYSVDISDKGAEDLKERDKVCISVTGSTSRLSTTVEESERATSSASSSSTSSAIFEVANMIVAQVIQQAVKTLESTDSERPASKKFIRMIKAVWKNRFCKKQSKKINAVWNNHFGKKQSKKVKTVSEYHVNEASPKPDLTSTPLKGQKEQDETPADDSKDETSVRGCKTKKRERCLRQTIKVRPAPVEDLNVAVTSRSAQESKQSSQPPQEKYPTTSPSTFLLRSTPLVLVDIEDEDMTEEDTTDVVSSPQEKFPTTSSSAALKPDLRSTPLVLVDIEDEDMTEEDTTDVVSSLSSTRSILPGHQVFEGLDDPPLAEITTDEDQENMSYQSESGDEDEEETSSQISASQNEETRTKKSNGFCSFFRSIFSKKNNKKKEKKMAQAKQPPLWNQLFCCSVYSCCFDN